ncbi:MAG: TonB-dependent receptor [Cryomorphaceae bacterium BACL29 MAG-121220-bin8]|jgi:outer membrane receptor for ferrienterochelin and colicins|nr:MAG: TonB-dependent receptor [Cryomorphaceae bacterium BACL29 MAG-121220-bin8]|tara:strand:- start:433 stop:2655 length:2223 start_codon:yes stop_codon:yes gene_type:complete
MNKILFLFTFFLTLNVQSQKLISGKITYVNESNIESVLEGVSVYWEDLSYGATSDFSGNYSIPSSASSNKLIFKFIGFKQDTIEIGDNKKYNHLMVVDNSQLDEVVVNKRKKTIQKSYFKTQNIINVSSDELLKAACCNISESFETNPSIDVSYSNAVTGVKQVKMLGLESPYLLITEENIPMIRGASQVYGLSFIPGTWVESMQITKGSGSVVNGFESISGQINVELKKPYSDNPLSVNVYSNNMGRNEINIHGNKKFNDKLSSGIYLHANKNSSINDNNNDGFLDQPTSKAFNLFNRWQYINPEKGTVSFLGVRYMKDDKVIGENTKDMVTIAPWKGEINTSRFDSNFKFGYVNASIPYQSLGLQMAFSKHDQNSFFGSRNYNINQNSFYSNIIYNSIIGNTLNKIKVGLNYSYDDFDELVDKNNFFTRIDKSIGGFFEYSYDSMDAISLVAGIRYDIHNNLGSFFTPRLHMRYQPYEKSVIRLSLGSGRKASNIFSENQNIFATGREIKRNNVLGKFYGLDPEKAFNYGISLRQGFFINNREGDITFDYYVTDFDNQVVVDWETQGELSFYNLNGKSFSKSLQIDLEYQILDNVLFKSTFKNYDVKKQYNSGFKQNPLTPKNRFFTNIEASTNENENGSKWKLDFTYNWIGNQRLPSHTSLIDFKGSSPSYNLINSQITRVFSNKFEIYIGGENIGGYTQKNPVLGGDDPFGTNFDTSLIYAPIHGALFYVGLRFNN